MSTDPVLKKLLELGLPIIPLCSPDHKGMPQWHVTVCTTKSNRGKVPLLKGWQEHRRTSSRDMEQWDHEWPGHGYGLLMGGVSGIVGVDVDNPKAEVYLTKHGTPASWEFNTGKGRRILYDVPKDAVYKKKIPVDGLELLGSGQQSAIPPTIHHTGRKYEWKPGCSPMNREIAPAPDWILRLMTEGTRPKETRFPDQGDIEPADPCAVEDFLTWTCVDRLLKEGCGEGKRYDGGRTLAAGLFERKMPEDEVRKIIRGYLTRCTPPKTDDLDHVVTSGRDMAHKGLHFSCQFQRERGFCAEGDHDKCPRIEKARTGLAKKTLRKTDEPAANRLVQMAMGLGSAELFMDERGQPCIAFVVDMHREIRRIDSSTVKDWIAGLAFNNEGKVVGSEVVENVIRILRAKARFEGPRCTLHNRVAMIDGDLWYDLSDDQWRAVHITRSGYKVVERPPIIFRRYAHMKSQALPEHGGNIDDFFKLHNLPTGDGDELLYKAHQIVIAIPDIPRCIEELSGEQGCAKSTGQSLTKQLIDPSLVGEGKLPEDDNLVLVLEHHYIPFFGNITEIDHDQSNTLSRAVTGEGHETRELYTNDDAWIRAFFRAILMNGINTISGLPDMRDRVVSFELQTITDDERRTDKESKARFEKIRGRCLGAVFDILSKALAIHDDLHIDRLPRMADYCEWGEAVAIAMGFKPGSFVDAYKENRGILNRATLDDDLVGGALSRLLEEQADHTFVGTASELLGSLEPVATAMKIDVKKAKGWPKQPTSLARRVKVIQANLKNDGYAVDKVTLERAANDERFVTWKKTIDAMIWSPRTMIYVIRPKPNEPLRPPNQKPLDNPSEAPREEDNTPDTAPKGVTAPTTAPTTAPNGQTPRNDEKGAVERSFPLRAKVGIDTVERLRLLLDACTRGVSLDDLRSAYGAELVEHALSRGILPLEGALLQKGEKDRSTAPLPPVSDSLVSKERSAERSRKKTAPFLPDTAPTLPLDSSAPPTPPNNTNGKLTELANKLLLEEAEHKEDRLKRSVGDSWPFVSDLIDDCAQGGTDKIDFWGAADIRRKVSRTDPKPITVIEEMLVNDVNGYQRTLKLIARARIIKAKKEAPP